MRQDFLRTEKDTSPEIVSFERFGTSNKRITRIILDEWRHSDKIEDIKTAREYYMVRNTRIAEKTRGYTDAQGDRQENHLLSNEKLKSAFLRYSTKQKVNYAFGKPFAINVENVNLDAEQQKDDEAGAEYQREWEKLIDKHFRKTMKRLATSAVYAGIAWCYVWIDGGKLKITDIASDTIYPQWSDAAHTELDVIIREYMQTIYEDDERDDIIRVEYWDDKTVERYIDKDGELVPDTYPVNGQEAGNSHMRRQISAADTETGEEAIDYEDISWGRIPFIALKGDEDELPLLNVIKDHIDAYDMLDSESVDTIHDDIDPLLVVENMSPDVGGLTQARELIKNSRIISTDSDGKVYYVQVKADITAAQMKQEALRKEIREFSATVDTQDIKFGSNPSGVALKAMYQDLDTYINGLETEFEVFMENLKYFFDRWLEFRGIGTVEQWEQYKATFTLDRDMMINEDALMDNAVKLQNLGVSQETLFGYIPFVESAEVEKARLSAEREEMMEQQREMMELQSEAFALQRDVEANDGEA